MPVSIYPYLRQAIGVLKVHRDEQAPPKDAWSATYSALSNLLGDRFSKALRKSGELRYDYGYSGNAFFGEGVLCNEHVVPLKCIIEALIASPNLWEGEDGVETLKEFLVEHLILARVPKLLNDALCQSKMPKNSDWVRLTGPNFSVENKQQEIWGRYASIDGLVLPFHGNQHFTRVHPIHT